MPKIADFGLAKAVDSQTFLKVRWLMDGSLIRIGLSFSLVRRCAVHLSTSLLR